MLISFEEEHILIWRGKEWKPSFTKPENDSDEVLESYVDGLTDVAVPPSIEGQPLELVPLKNVLDEPNMTSTLIDSKAQVKHSASKDTSSTIEINHNESRAIDTAVGNETILNDEMPVPESQGPSTRSEMLVESLEGSFDLSKPVEPSVPYEDELLKLQKEAVENGSAVVLDDASLDADIVYQRAIAFAQSAPPGPVFRHRPRKIAVQKSEEQDNNNEILEVQVTSVSQTAKTEKRSPKVGKTKSREKYTDLAPQGSSLKLDELAKLLA